MKDTQQQEYKPTPQLLDVDLGDVADEDLIALWLLEEERAAQASLNIRNIKAEAYNRVPHGTPLTVFESDVLGGRLEVPVTVLKKRFRSKRKYDDVTIINKLRESERDLLTNTRVLLDRKAFETLLEEDERFARDFEENITWSAETDRLELQNKNAWLRSRGL